MDKNLYEVLGITQEEKRLQGKDFENVVRDKFRALAKEKHPDKFTDPKEKEKAEVEFKKIAEAKDVLSDPQKRQQYDMTGSTSGFNYANFHDTDLDDIINSFMHSRGFGFGGWNQARSYERQYKGQDIQLKINLTIQDVYNGTVKKYKYKRDVVCTHCDGGSMSVCQHCRGTGMITKTVQMGPSIMQTSTSCPYCGGSGNTMSGSKNCSHCHGSGVVKQEETISVTIPRGCTVGNIITIEGAGNQLPKAYNGLNGNLRVVINNIECGDFQIQDYHLIIEKEIPIIDIMTGCEVEIVTPLKQKHKITIPKNTKDGSQFRLSGRGLPVGNSGRFGDIYVIVSYKFPKKIDKEELKILEKLRKSGNFA